MKGKFEVDQIFDREQVAQQKKSWFKALSSWIKRHPLLVLAGSIVLIFLVEYLSLPGITAVKQLGTVNPQTTALMKARREQHKAGWRIAHQWVPLSRISSHLIHAVIVSEDGTFYEHDGVDWFEVQESVERNLVERRVIRGASTITQQLAKNLYLSTSRDPLRKLKEFILTMRLEGYLSKNRILELYLNVIEWGDGIFGAEAASLVYFGKPASELTREEAAELTSVIPSPLRHRPNNESRYVLSRTGIILLRMNARGW